MEGANGRNWVPAPAGRVGERGPRRQSSQLVAGTMIGREKRTRHIVTATQTAGPSRRRSWGGDTWLKPEQ